MYNNKLLAAIFIGLFALYGITKVVKANRGNRSFKSQIVSVDTAQVQSMVLYPQAEQYKEIRFVRSPQGWMMQRGKVQVLLEAGKLANVLGNFRSVKPERLVANNKSKWAEFQLTDSLATRVKLLGANGQELASLLVGKAGVGGVAYVRVPNTNEVYAVDSYMATNLNKPFKAWRNQEVINLISHQVEKISFTYPKDSSLVIEKTKEGWKMGETMADSTLVAQYLNAIANKRSDDFSDDFKPQGTPQFMLTLSGKAMIVKGKPAPQVVVQGFEANNEVYLRTSVNPMSIFRSKKTKLFAELFKTKEDFIKKKEQKKEEEKK